MSMPRAAWRKSVLAKRADLPPCSDKIAQKRRAVKTLILHLGLQKTGSTSIQETFMYNPEPLAAAGYRYAILGWPDETNSNHSFPLIVAFSDGWQTNPEIARRNWKVDGLKTHFMAEINRALDTDQNVIFSGEDISDIPVEGLRAFSDLAREKGFAVRPIMFVRPPLEFITSMSQTRIRHGDPFHIFEGQKSANIDVCLQVWPDMTCIVFQVAARHPKGPCGMLVDAFGLSSSDRYEVVSANNSMSDFSTRIIGHINRQIPLYLDGAVNPLRHYLDTEPLAQIKGPKFILTRSEFMGVREFVQTENAAIAQLLGPEFCDQSFNFGDTPHPWAASALGELAEAMKPLAKPLKDCIRGYFSHSPDVSLTERKLAKDILGRGPKP